ncbi:uncharacterized protein [Elaeis guineensis]|uniref:uncharacterized protein n=1 Tax=Elaeis guineensis var. tenera TaxID=51953 RepID=UPI003C6D3923
MIEEELNTADILFLNSLTRHRHFGHLQTQGTGSLEGQWVIVGDFNTIRFPNERKGNSNSASVSEAFNSFVDNLELNSELKDLIAAWWKTAPTCPDASTTLVVKLGYFRRRLKARGFSDKWCKWVDCTLTTNKVALILNGNPSKWIKTKQGLKQGDPLSPILFILVTDILNQILKLSAKNGLIAGMGSSSTTDKIICLQYADDAILFSDANLQHIQHLKFMLYAFEILSRLKINFDKTALYTINLSQIQARRFAVTLGCKLEGFPATYLSFPMSTGHMKAADWSFLI